MNLPHPRKQACVVAPFCICLSKLSPYAENMASFFNNAARAAAAASSSKSKPDPVLAPRSQPWVEKYRPKTLEEVRSQDHATFVLRRLVNASNLPHLLLYGPPGTGKTSTILALAKELYGPQLYQSRILELNASDERGISVVREKIKDFARQQISTSHSMSKEYLKQYPCPNFKIIILDEADSLTQDAQSALRRTMEQYSKVTRFCLCCNYVSRIIDPLASRCSKFRFKSLDGGDAAARLQDIIKAEGVSCEDGVVGKLLQTSEGDLRRAITYLQSAHRLTTAMSLSTRNGSKKSRKSKVVDDDEDEEMTDADTPSGSQVTVGIIEEIAGVVPPGTIDDLLTAMQPNKKVPPFNAIRTHVDNIVMDGWSANQVLLQLYANLIIQDETISAAKKNRMVAVFSECDRRLIDGSEEHLLLLDMALQLSGILSA